MRRLILHVADDITVAEVIEMARVSGFFVRFTNGMTALDRVPGIVRKSPALNVVSIRAAAGSTEVK